MERKIVRKSRNVPPPKEVKKVVVLDASTLGADLDLSSLHEFCDELKIYETTSLHELNDRIKDAYIIITNKVIIEKTNMLEAKKLELICIAATGMNNVDLEGAKELKISVRNVVGYSTASVNQHTFMMAFNLMGKVKYFENRVQSGEWKKSAIFTDVSNPFSELSSMTWGIVGLGKIGNRVASTAEFLGAKVQYYSTSGKNTISPYHRTSLEKLLETSDIISVHCPLNEHTKNLINTTNLSLLKEGAIILNLARGGIINEADLAQEINTREVYAGLDVFETEPIENDNPLLNVEHKDRLILTPHIAWTSKEARIKLLEGIVANIKDYLLKKIH